MSSLRPPPELAEVLVTVAWQYSLLLLLHYAALLVLCDSAALPELVSL